MKFKLSCIYSTYERLGYDLFTLPITSETSLNDFGFSNTNGSCLAFAIAQCVNDFYGKNVIRPFYSYLPSIYHSLNELKRNNSYDATSEKVSLKNLLDSNYVGIASVCCNGGYHAIYIKNGFIYNNWRNGFTPLTLEDYKKQCGYVKTPKLRQFTPVYSVVGIYKLLLSTDTLYDYFAPFQN